MTVSAAGSDVARPGPRRPVVRTPARGAGSVRRTSTLDMNRPDGPAGPVRLSGVARDAVTGDPGKPPVVAGSVRLDGVVDWADGRRVVALDSDPHDPRLDSLVGQSAATGFRGAARRAVPEVAEQRGLLNLLLDDVPVGTLVSGFALHRTGPGPIRTAQSNPPKPDLCAGWARGGSMMLTIERTGRSPVAQGAQAPSEPDDDDPFGWHEAPELLPGGVRRRRRLDLTWGPVLAVDATFRDSYLGFDSDETVIHEYVLRGAIDPETLTVLEMVAEPRVLPWTECPSAAGSAGRLVGRNVAELRDFVRADFVGTSTCTHLNDAFRSLEDIVAVARLLPGAVQNTERTW